MDNIQYLPIGSLIKLEGNDKKFMIVARGFLAEVAGKQYFFDYGASIYPMGLDQGNILYFNHENIAEVVDEGYSDDDDKIMSEFINKQYIKGKHKKADIKKLKEEMKQNK